MRRLEHEGRLAAGAGAGGESPGRHRLCSALVSSFVLIRGQDGTALVMRSSHVSHEICMQAHVLRKWNMQMEGDKSDRMSRRALSTLLGASIIYSLSPDVSSHHRIVSPKVLKVSLRSRTLASLR